MKDKIICPRGFINKDGKLDIVSYSVCDVTREVYRASHTSTKLVKDNKSVSEYAKQFFGPLSNNPYAVKAAEKMIAYIKNTAALNDIVNKSQEDTERERECRIRSSISSIAKRLAGRQGLKLFKSKIIELAVTGGNSSGAVITSNHVVTIEFSDLNSWLDFNKMLRKTKFLKEVKVIEDGKLLYKFNIKVYDKHELNLDKSLSNFSDIFTGYYYNLCKEKDIDFIDVNAVSNLATRLIDDEWCKSLY